MFNRAWYDENNEIIYCRHLKLSKHIETITKFRYNRKIREWYNGNKEKVFMNPTCDHLRQLIKDEIQSKYSKSKLAALEFRNIFN